ncbi:MAG: hypothetical protein V1816_22390 [Pseudomonadota bacterium]
MEGVYPCLSRCVRRAFLCGNDPYTGRSLEHRKDWVQARLEFLAGSFALEICAFAVMSNHLHVVARTRPDLAEAWSDEETARRWLRVFPKKRNENHAPASPSPLEIKNLRDSGVGLEALRQRLSSISWFMRSLNENIARRANREDGCKGRFWEGRFKCQVILDDSALLACMAYVDLNPVRAGAAACPETSSYTSAFLRLEARQARERTAKIQEKTHPPYSPERQLSLDRQKVRSKPDHWLCPLPSEGESSRPGLLDLTLDQYLTLLDWTGRQLRADRKKSCPWT